METGWMNRPTGIETLLILDLEGMVVGAFGVLVGHSVTFVDYGFFLLALDLHVVLRLTLINFWTFLY